MKKVEKDGADPLMDKIYFLPLDSSQRHPERLQGISGVKGGADTPPNDFLCVGIQDKG